MTPFGGSERIGRLALRPERVPVGLVEEVFLAADDAAIFELEGDAAIGGQHLAAPDGTVVMDADDQALLVSTHRFEFGLEGAVRLAAVSAE